MGTRRCDDVFVGSEHSARLQVFFALCEEQLPEQIAASVLREGSGDLLREALAEQLSDRLFSAVVGSEDRPPSFQLGHGTSATHWARAYLSAGARGMAQRLSASMLRERQELISDQAAASCIVPDGSWGTEQVTITTDRLKHATGQARRLEGAKRLHEAFDIPPLTPPSDASERRRLWELVRECPGAVRDSLARASEEQLNDTPLDGIWRDFTPDDAACLLERDERILMLVTEAALAALPRPGIHLLRAHRQLMKAASTRRGWPSIAARVQAAWVAHHFCARADRDTTARMAGDPSGTAVEATWEEAAHEAASFPGAPLGAVLPDIHRTLMQLLDAAKETTP